MADTDENPKRMKLGPRRKRMERRSTAAPTDSDRAPGRWDAGSTVGTANSAAESEKPDMMLKYRWNGVLYWCAGAVRQAAVPLAGILSVGS